MTSTNDPYDDPVRLCVLAFDMDTGKLKWRFQFTPHDVFDYDASDLLRFALTERPGH